jgi:long-chain acyl-CoA synthetase
MAFMRCCFSCNVMEGYGQTENAAAATATLPGDCSLGHVGPPLPCVEIKLVDVPEMMYFSSDMPRPRGEVCLRGPVVFQRYHTAPKVIIVIVKE